MELKSSDLAKLLDYAIKAAQQAGELIEQYASRAVKVEHKSGGNTLASQVVTEVDLLSEAIIIKALKPSCEEYDLALLTEEHTDDGSRLEKDFFWCVDPMDGTLSFIESIPGYAVSIALVSRAGEPVIGVVYDPVTHTLYSAAAGQGALRNNQPWTVNQDLAQSAPLTLVCDRGFSQQPYYIEFVQQLTALSIKSGLNGLQVLERNGSVLNACWLLDNPPAVYVKCPKPQQGGGSLWDFAATAALFKEIGATVSDVYGQPLDLNRPESTFMNHRGVFFTSARLLSEDIQSVLTSCQQ